MKKLSPVLTGLIQASAVVLYCILAVFFMNNLNTFIPYEQATSYGFVILIFFIVSALITASMVFAYPLILFIEEKRKREAVQIVLLTTLWLTIIFSGIILLSLLF